MKLTKTLLAAVALATFAMPTTASAQMSSSVNLNEVIGHMSAVNGNMYIERAGQILKVMEDSGVVAGDKIVAELGASGMVNLNGCNGKFTPCNQFVSDGNMVLLKSNNYCNDLAAIMPMGPNDAVLTAAANSPVGYTGGPSIGTAMSGKALATILGVAAAGTGLYLVLEDDDEPTSP